MCPHPNNCVALQIRPMGTMRGHPPTGRNIARQKAIASRYEE
jgi:hypothetical protein